MPGTKLSSQFNNTLSDRLGTVAPDFNYFKFEIAGPMKKELWCIRAGYIPNTGGTYVTTNLRVGRIMVLNGTANPGDTSIMLDPFSMQNKSIAEGRIIVDDIIRNEFVMELNEPIRFESGDTLTVIIGMSVGEADTASAPSSSNGYLTVLGRTYYDENQRPFPYILR